MLLPQTKEREYRFRLALRMGLPIFALIIAFTSHTLVSNYNTLNTSFYIEAIALLFVSVYFILYLIYAGFNVKITDDVTKTFSREYLYNYLNKEIKNKKEYTLILLNIDNLHDINKMYGIKNGDKVLKKVVEWINSYMKNEGIENFPLGHIKGGDFILGLEGSKDKYSTILDLMCLKSNELKVDDIEIKFSGAITDTNYSQDLDYLIEHLFELQSKKKNLKNEDIINPNELEKIVIDSLSKRSFTLMEQDVYEGNKSVFKEAFIRLNAANGKIIHPKSYRKVLNKLSLGVDFDLMVIEEIITKYADKQRYAINIFPTSLRNDKFLTKLKELLKEYNNSKIILILSEMEYYSFIKRYNSIIDSLRKMDVWIAIDRLGSIHTSFLYLRELEIDIVRFDTYYSNDKKLQKNLSIIEGFQTMAQEKGVKTWMKNIENKESLAMAQKIGINYIQGKVLSNLELER
ncbi:EAL domain-containing protein [Sulfurimonas sp.]|uniref:bifunctional diguanylate cyclase/phosphodiesterase n=1 Tax=Sulfurimonas sp. TaxID=2022749 RepID=UPI00260AFE15|nr:EAL domain-containing protein [Sulfurimonas sp.]